MTVLPNLAFVPADGLWWATVLAGSVEWSAVCTLTWNPAAFSFAVASLTDREREILTLLASGYSNAELARRLYLSEPTIKTHLTSIFRKLGVRDRVQAVIAAYDARLVEPGHHGLPGTPAQGSGIEG